LRPVQRWPEDGMREGKVIVSQVLYIQYFSLSQK